MTDINALITSLSGPTPPPVSSGAIGAANTGYNTFAAGQPAADQSLTTNLQSEAGIPAQQGQYADIGSIFQLWLNDPNRTTGQYASSSLSTGNSPLYNSNTPMMNPVVGGVAPVQNPYLQSASDIINSVTQPSGQGFQGFTTPGLINSAVGVVPGAAASIQSGLQNTMNSEQGLINQDVGTYDKNYAAALSAISNLASSLTNAYSMTGPGTATSITASENSVVNDVKNGMTLNSVMQKYGTDQNLTADKILQLYNENSPYGAAKESPDVLANTYGVSGGLGKQPPTKNVSLGNGQTGVYTLQPDGTYVQTSTIGTVGSKAPATKTYNKHLYSYNSSTGQWDLADPGNTGPLSGLTNIFSPVPEHLGTNVLGKPGSTGATASSNPLGI